MEEFDLQSGERVIQTVRQHPLVIALAFVPYLLLAAIPAVLGGLLSFATQFGISGLQVATANSGAVRFITGLWWLFVWMAAFGAFTRYWLTQWIITSTRIVDIQQRSLFSRNVSSFLLARIQDVTTDVDGLLGTLVGFGKLKVQTAGQDEDFILRGVPHPQQVRDVIMDQVAALQHGPDLSGL